MPEEATLRDADRIIDDVAEARELAQSVQKSVETLNITLVVVKPLITSMTFLAILFLLFC